MGSEVARLEAELLAQWSRETLEQYGAALRAQGHPRGRLIEIDLLLEGEPADREALREEHAALQEAWLGELKVETQHGFIVSLLEEAADMPDALAAAAPWARNIDLWGTPAELANLFERFGALAWPWLASLEARCFGESTTAPRDALRNFAKAAPRLAKLSIFGHLVVEDVLHDGITHLIVDGHDACGAIRGTSVMPSVTHLDFALHPDFPIDREPPPEALRAGLVDAAAFPGLRVLDLSRNEPSADPRSPNCLGGRTPLFDILPRFKCLAQLDELRVPSLRRADQCAKLQAVIDRMPALRVLDVPRMYDSLPAPLHHTRAQISVGDPVSWPANDTLREYDALVFFVANQWRRVDFEEPYMLCETRYAKLKPTERAAWDELWRITRELGHDEQRKLDIATPTLQTLLATFEDDTYGWWDLKVLVDAVTDPAILVRRIDGYEEPYVPAAPPVERVGASTERIHEHEASLQAHWDLDRLAVYADDLQELGDERGELIAFDLEHADERRGDFRRSKLHTSIFGRDHVVSSKLGFAKVAVTAWDEASRLQKVLVGDVARYLSALEIIGLATRVPFDLGLVLAEPRPWLRSLRIEALGVVTVPGFAGAELPRLLPALEVLELATDTRTSIFQGFVHDRVRRLWITGGIALAGLGEPWPSVTELDFAFGIRNEGTVQPERVLRHAKLPALRILDLSRNEPEVPAGWENHLRHKCGTAFWTAIAGTERAVFAGLTHLRLPSPREVDHVRVIQDLLDHMPALERLEIVRCYPGCPEISVTHPRATLVIPEPSSWPPADRVAQTLNALAIEGVVVPLHPAVLAMERYHAEMPEAGRRAWDSIWAASGPDRFELPATTLYAAAEALKLCDAYAYDEWLDALIERLHPLAVAEASVGLVRVTRPQ